MTSASYKKDIILNEAQILQDAWSRYIANYSKGWSFESAYSHAKRKIEIENEKARLEASGMDLHTYTMSQYYNRGSYSYYGD